MGMNLCKRIHQDRCDIISSNFWRSPTLKGRHLEQSVNILRVRWYLNDGLSLRYLQERVAERGHTGSCTFRLCWPIVSIVASAPSEADGMPTTLISRFEASGRISQPRD